MNVRYQIPILHLPFEDRELVSQDYSKQTLIITLSAVTLISMFSSSLQRPARNLIRPRNRPGVCYRIISWWVLPWRIGTNRVMVRVMIPVTEAVIWTHSLTPISSLRDAFKTVMGTTVQIAGYYIRLLVVPPAIPQYVKVLVCSKMSLRQRREHWRQAVKLSETVVEIGS